MAQLAPNRVLAPPEVVRDLPPTARRNREERPNRRQGYGGPKPSRKGATAKFSGTHSVHIPGGETSNCDSRSAVARLTQRPCYGRNLDAVPWRRGCSVRKCDLVVRRNNRDDYTPCDFDQHSLESLGCSCSHTAHRWWVAPPFSSFAADPHPPAPAAKTRQWRHSAFAWFSRNLRNTSRAAGCIITIIGESIQNSL